MFIAFLMLWLQKASEFSTSAKGRIYDPPDGPLYYIVLIGASLLVLIAFIWAVKGFWKPGEHSDDHIKRKILDSDF